MTHSGNPVRGEVSDRPALAQALITARMEAGYTQGEMAKLMVTSRSTIVRMESGRDMPTVATLEKWAEVTGKRLDVRFL